MLPIITVSPIRLLIAVMIKTNNLPGKPPSTAQKTKQVFGLIFTGAVCGGCLYAMLIVAAANSHGETIQWLYGFGIIMA